MNTRYSVKKKVKKAGKEITETEWRCNSDKKREYMTTYHLKTDKEFADKVKGYENWSKFISPPLPSRFQWIWLHFLDIWRTCSRDFNGNVIMTPRTLIDYCECFKVFFTVQEKHLLFRIKNWAEDAMYQVREKNKDK